MNVINLLQVDGIWWDVVNGKVIEAFIKSGMGSNLNSRCFRITPENVVSGVGGHAQGNAVFGV